MSLNIDAKMSEALMQLRGHPAMEQFMSSQALMAHKHILAALKAPADIRAEAVGYARALHDWHLGVAAILAGKKTNQMEFPDTGATMTTTIEDFLPPAPDPTAPRKGAPK
jgi:hypothetical protein